MSQECGAIARSNNYAPCKRIAMANGRCYFHGGKSTGAKTAKGKLKQKMASWKHGLYSKEVIEENRNFREMLQEHKSSLRAFQ
jgi:hypothetical protein